MWSSQVINQIPEVNWNEKKDLGPKLKPSALLWKHLEKQTQ